MNQHVSALQGPFTGRPLWLTRKQCASCTTVRREVAAMAEDVMAEMRNLWREALDGTVRSSRWRRPRIR